MKRILDAIKAWAKKFPWVEMGLVLVYGLLTLAFCKTVGDVLFLFAAFLLARFIATKL
jgi:hypothetical protein